MKSFVEKYFYYLLFTPIIAYIAFNFKLGVNNLYGFSIFIFFLLWMYSNKKLNRIVVFPSYLFPLVLYVVYTTFWLIIQSSSFITPFMPQNLFVNHGLLTILVIVIIDNNPFSPRFVKKSFYIIKYTIIISFLFQLVQTVSPKFFIPQSTDDQTLYSIYADRRYGVFGYVDFNAYGLSFIPLIATYVFYLFIEKKNNTNLVYAFILLGACISLLTNTRYIMAGYLFLFILLLINKNIVKNKLLVFRNIFIIVVLVGVILKTLGYDFKEYYETRLWEEGDIKNTTRYLAYQVFLKFYPQNWFLGNGLEQSLAIKQEIGGRSSQIHVGYLKHMVTYGLVGSFLLFSFWLLFLRSLYLKARKSRFYAGFFSMLFFLFANATFPYYSILSYGMIFSFIVSNYYYLKYESVRLNSKESMLKQSC